MKRILTIITLLLVFSLTSIQVFSQNMFNTGSSRGAGWLTGKLPENASFNLEVGTSFNSFSSGTSMLNNYFSPQLKYDLSSSLSIIAGGSFVLSQYGNLPKSIVVHGNAANMQQGFSDYSLFMSGRYTIKDNLFMTGTVYREQGHLPINTMNQGVQDYNSHGMSMGIEYRLSNNIHFGAEVGINKSDNPFFYSSPFSDPFGNSPRNSRHRFFP